MCFHFSSKLGTLSFLNRCIVFDVHGVHDLTTHAFSHDTCTDTFTRCIDCRCITCRTTTNHQYIKGIFSIELFSLFCCRVDIQFCHDFFQSHTTLTDMLVVLEHHRHRHDFAFFHFILEECPINHGGCCARVVNCYQV